MRGRTMMAVAVAMVLCAATPTTAAVTVVCNGSECGGSGPRDYWYEVTITHEYAGFMFNAGTADRNTGNYSNSMVAYLVGDVWDELDDGATPGGDYDTFFGYGAWALDIHSPMTAHGGGPVTPNGKSNMVIAWSVNITVPAGTYGLGYDNDFTDPIDVSWFLDDGTLPDDTSDWSKVVGTGLGPVHGPSPEPATLSLVAVGIGTLLLRRRRQ